MRCFGLGLASSLVGFFAFGSAPAQAEGLGWSEQPEDPEAIYGGETVAVCGWPTTVSMQGSCTGTLVHPQVVVYAQHCGSNVPSVWMGEDIEKPSRTLQTEFCRTIPGGGPGTGLDVAFCKLKEPVLDVPIVPILMGCETEILQPGQGVTVVGFGLADNGPYGIKRAVSTTIKSFMGKEINIGGGGKDSCNGDSGGPVYVELPGIGWRVFGITSYGPSPCGPGGTYSMMHNGVAWIEQESGIDITPCHAADGTWAPTFGCRGFPLDPSTGGGAWAQGCGGGGVEDFSATCGAAFDPAPDLEPPTVSFVSPTDGQLFMGDGMVTVTIDAQDVGWGVKEVHLLINGEAFPGNVDSFPPYEYALKFPNGGFVLDAQAIDLADNIGDAVPVSIGVNAPAPVPEPEPEPDPEPTPTTGDDSSASASAGESGDESGALTGDGGNDDDGSAGVDSASGTAGADDSGEGCGCRQSRPDAGLLALAGLGLLAWRRRR
jgi:MYXO-CTERM domain-containing protein